MHRTSSIRRWQLIFTGSIVSVAVAVAVLLPTVFAAPMFLVGLAIVVLATLASLVVPWDRVASGWAVALPFADILAIACTTGVQELRIGFLWVIPVAWIATYYTWWVIASAVAAISVALMAVAGTQGTPSDATMRVVITMLALSFLGTVIRIGTLRSRATRRLLRRQSQQVRRAAERAGTHEKRVTQIIDALDTALVAVSDRGAILKTNSAYRRLYGRDTFGAQLPSPAIEYDGHRGEPVPRAATTLARAARGEQLDGERVWLFDAGGRWRALQASTQSIARLDEDIATTLLVIEDVTAQVEAEEQRSRMRAIVSHELRNPLTAILGHVDLLLEHPDLPARARRQLETVSSASERMQSLVTSALDAGRASALRFEMIDLRRLADASAELFLASAHGKNLTLTVEGQSELFVRGDAFRLRQALDNLVSNAVKYTPAGGEVTLHLSTADDERAELMVCDTGAGIAPDDLDRLFEPYFRSQAAISSGTQGTGLGLSIARDIVFSHRGELLVTSEVGVGTRVRVVLPGVADDDRVGSQPGRPGTGASTATGTEEIT